MSLRKVETIENGKDKAIVYKDSEWGEFRVKFYFGGEYQPNADYHTDDKSDAIGTAKLSLNK